VRTGDNAKFFPKGKKFYEMALTSFTTDIAVDALNYVVSHILRARSCYSYSLAVCTRATPFAQVVTGTEQFFGKDCNRTFLSISGDGEPRSPCLCSAQISCNRIASRLSLLNLVLVILFHFPFIMLSEL